MSVEFQTSSVSVPSGTGRLSIPGSVNFSSSVISAASAVNGFKFDFDSSDHHINIVEADTDIVSVSGNTVNFRVQCNYADKNFDDKYSGYVTALIVADVA